MRAFIATAFLALLVFLVAPSLAKQTHHSIHKSSNTTHADPNELLPSLCANGATVTRGEREKNLASLETCKYDRDSAIDVFNVGFDVNGDGLFTIEECYEARRAYIKTYEEPFAESCEDIFRHCDCNADGAITEIDFRTALDTCLRNCDFIEKFMKYVGSRMPKEIQKLIKIRTF